MMTISDDEIVSAYEDAVSRGCVAFGERARGAAATLAAAAALGLSSSSPIIDALRRRSHPHVAAWHDWSRRVAEAAAGPKHGRPRKEGARTESGRLSRAKARAISADAQILAGHDRRAREAADDTASVKPAELIRMRDLIRAQVGERPTAWLTQAGRDFLARQLQEGEFAAATRLHDARHRYLEAIQAKSCARSANLDPSGGEPLDPDSAEGIGEAERHARHIAAWEAIEAEIAGALEALAAGAASDYRRRQTAKGALLRYCCDAAAGAMDGALARPILRRMVEDQRARAKARKRAGRG